MGTKILTHKILPHRLLVLSDTCLLALVALPNLNLIRNTIEQNHKYIIQTQIQTHTPIHINHKKWPPFKITPGWKLPGNMLQMWHSNLSIVRMAIHEKICTVLYNPVIVWIIKIPIWILKVFISPRIYILIRGDITSNLV